MKNPIITGIDHGNANIKTVHAVFPAGIVSHGKMDPGTDHVLEFAGEYFSLSCNHGAIERDKTATERYYLLTLIGICVELEKRGLKGGEYEIVLATGLPPGNMSKENNRNFGKYFTRQDPVRFKYNGEKYTIHFVKTFVFPQALSAVAQAGRNMDVVTKKRFLIMDIGGGTIEYVLMQNGKPDLEKYFSLPEGTITMAKEIAKDIRSRYGLELTESDITDVLKEEETLLSEAVQKDIRAINKEKAIHLINQARDIGIDTMVCPVFLTGGGAQFVKKFFTLENRIAKVNIEENLAANAIGYELLARAKMQR